MVSMPETPPTRLPAGATLRPAREGDEVGILACIHELAEHEREPNAVNNTADDLRETLFGVDPRVFAHVVEREHAIVGIAVWFANYSTWTGRGGIYLEDLYVQPDQRGLGYGLALIRGLAEICVEHGYARLNWSVRDWNTSTIRFYQAIGARPVSGLTGYVLDGDGLAALGTSAS